LQIVQGRHPRLHEREDHGQDANKSFDDDAAIVLPYRQGSAMTPVRRAKPPHGVTGVVPNPALLRAACVGRASAQGRIRCIDYPMSIRLADSIDYDFAKFAFPTAAQDCGAGLGSDTADPHRYLIDHREPPCRAGRGIADQFRTASTPSAGRPFSWFTVRPISLR